MRRQNDSEPISIQAFKYHNLELANLLRINIFSVARRYLIPQKWKSPSPLWIGNIIARCESPLKLRWCEKICGLWEKLIDLNVYLLHTRFVDLHLGTNIENTAPKYNP